MDNYRKDPQYQEWVASLTPTEARGALFDMARRLEMSHQPARSAVGMMLNPKNRALLLKALDEVDDGD